MESTVMISSLLCNILIEHKREKREEKKALQDDEYHAKRMEALK